MTRITKLLAAVPLVVATSTWLWISTVRAHEFIIKPAALRVNAVIKCLSAFFRPTFS
jgi:hypothetical protein